MKSSSLRVLMNGRWVGSLNRQASGAIDFKYESSWLSFEHALPVSLSMPLREDRFIGAPVIAVFDNLLPDNHHIRQRIAARMRASGTDAYNLLMAVGRDCVGALQFIPENEPILPVDSFSGIPLEETDIAKIILDLGRIPLGVDAEFRISLAGAQEKTALLWHQGKWHKPLGSTPTTHILKPQIGRLPSGPDFTHSVENEYLCLKIVQAFGLPVASAHIQIFDGQKVLVVERFDRHWTQDGRLIRIPQEDCCQALSVPSALKYECDGGPGVLKILGLLKESDTPEEDRITFLKAQIVFWLLSATDGHGKNFSLTLFPEGRFRLAPLYDILSTQLQVDQGGLKKVKMAMALGDNRHYKVDEIRPRHFMQTAQKAGMDVIAVKKWMTHVFNSADDVLTSVESELPHDFPQELVKSIFSGLRRRLRLIHE